MATPHTTGRKRAYRPARDECSERSESQRGVHQRVRKEGKNLLDIALCLLPILTSTTLGTSL